MNASEFRILIRQEQPKHWPPARITVAWNGTMLLATWWMLEMPWVLGLTRAGAKLGRPVVKSEFCYLERDHPELFV